MEFKRYHENLKSLHVGTCEKRSYYVPASSRFISQMPREVSDRALFLNGSWKFLYCENDTYLPEDFYKTDFDTSRMDTITVPSVWQNFGYDSHNYLNHKFPIPYEPPYVPFENPCGLYIRNFELSKDNLEKYLVFEGVDSCMYVFINGSFVGYSQCSHNISEFNVSKFVHEGVNTIAVLVYRYCDGTYLEDQDKLRMNGIFRDVYLLSRPKSHIEDFFIHQSFDENFKKAVLDVNLTIKGSCVPLVSLYMDETLVAKEKGKSVSLCIDNPILWNAEEPHLYTLVLETGDEVISKKIGLRKIEIKDKVVLLNGQNIKLRGTNRHDSSPVNGYSVTYDEMYQDITMMKAHNMNAIRTSHYPNSPIFLELCDQLGMYVIGESDVEIHGPVDVYGGYDESTFSMLADDPDWIEPICDRIMANVERDKNVTSVIIWSMGNEAGYGCCFEEAAKRVKKRDNSRLLHYEGAIHAKQYDVSLLTPSPLCNYKYTKRKNNKYDFSNIDLHSRMYPSYAEVDEYLKTGDKPYIMCEYCHAMGNGPGDIEGYWERIYKFDSFLGGFIWEWCDHSVYMGTTPDGRAKYYYGGDWNDNPHDGNFCMDGLTYPDRTPHTGLLEVQNVYRPVRLVKVKGNEYTFKNYLDFKNLKDNIELEYRILENGVVKANGRIPLIAKPHGNVKVNINEAIPNNNRASILFIYHNISKDKAEYMPEEMGFDQYIPKDNLVSNVKVETISSKKAPTVSEDKEFISITGSKFKYVYSKKEAGFVSINKDNVSFLSKPLNINIWRAPTDNDNFAKMEWYKFHYDNVTYRTRSVSIKEKDNCLELKTDVSVSAVAMVPLLVVHVTYLINDKGVIKVNMTADKDPRTPFLPRFGLRLFMDKEFEDVEYFGYGPNESYSDKRKASYLSRFEDTVSHMHEDYIYPQENGSHFGCLEFSVSTQRPVMNQRSVKVYGNPFSFNVSHYTQEELTQKAHNFELNESDFTVLCIDAGMSGIGSNSCGPELAKEYRIDNDDKGKFPYELSVIIDFL